MSASTALALIIATDFAGFFCLFWLTKLANDVAAEIETGVIRGTPISTKYRWLLLYQSWFTYVFGAMIAGILSAMLNVRIAAHATAGDVKAVAYVGAVIGGTAAFGWVLFGVSELIHYRSTLRQAEAD